MSRPYMPITDICAMVAEGLSRGDDFSPTTIRCAINDAIDAYEKDGYRVKPDYNQARAIKRVRQILGEK